MAGVQELAAAVRTALGKLPTAKLTEAAGLLGEAVHALTQTGSQQPEVQAAITGLNATEQGIGDVTNVVGRVNGTLTGYLERIGTTTPPEDADATAGPPTQPTAASSPATTTPDGQRLTRERAEALQAELPPPVTTMTGQKTHGRWVDEDGQAHEIVSGKDADAAEAAQLLREKGIPQRGDVTTTADVEQKIAARMVREGRKHVEVVLNNRPCRGVFGCDTLLPVILPKGYSLTVHAPNYRKTFTGGK
jgi:type IV secretory pathway VirB10-like protein